MSTELSGVEHRERLFEVSVTALFVGTWIAIFVGHIAFLLQIRKLEARIPGRELIPGKELLVKVQKVPEHLVPDLSIGFAAHASLADVEPEKPKS